MTTSRPGLVRGNGGGPHRPFPRPATVPRQAARVGGRGPGSVASGVVEAEPERSVRRVDGGLRPELVGDSARRTPRDDAVVSEQRESRDRSQPAVERGQRRSLVAVEIGSRVADVDPPGEPAAGGVDGDARIGLDARARIGANDDPDATVRNGDDNERGGLRLRPEMGASVRRAGNLHGVPGRVRPGYVESPAPRNADARVVELVACAIDLDRT